MTEHRFIKTVTKTPYGIRYRLRCQTCRAKGEPCEMDRPDDGFGTRLWIQQHSGCDRFDAGDILRAAEKWTTNKGKETK